MMNGPSALYAFFINFDISLVPMYGPTVLKGSRKGIDLWFAVMHDDPDLLAHACALPMPK